jgi:hypothetical protein
MGRDRFDVMLEFLWARIREDETAAQALRPGKNEAVAKLKARVLADVETKRRLLDWVEEYPRRLEDNGELGRWMRTAGEIVAESVRGRRSPVVYKLVAAYADHPDFHPEWLPIEDEAV